MLRDDEDDIDEDEVVRSSFLTQAVKSNNDQPLWYTYSKYNYIRISIPLITSDNGNTNANNNNDGGTNENESKIYQLPITMNFSMPSSGSNNEVPAASCVNLRIAFTKDLI